MNLNPQQEKAADWFTGPLLCTACPGAGTTGTLTERISRLIQKGVSASNILALTFTNKAANEMKERIVKKIGDEGRKVYMSTFHALCANILRHFGEPIGLGANMTIVDSDEQQSLIEQVARGMEIDLTKPKAAFLATLVNNLRENMEGQTELDTMVARRFIKDEDKEIVNEYLAKLKKNTQTDFSGLLSETVYLLENYPDILGKLQKKFQFIQVDEYQDTNKIQIKLANMIAAKTRNIVAVGDSDQSIYTWRGAYPESFKDFTVTYPEAEICPLGQNYRSTPQIIKVADTLIKHNPGRMDIKFTTNNPDGSPVKLHRYHTPELEAESIANQIERLIIDGIEPKEIAVFYRMNNMSRAVEMQLKRKRIPYKIVGGANYYDRMEVKDIISMLKFMCNPKDGVSFHRIANKPTRGLGNVAVGQIENFAAENDIDLIEACRRSEEFFKGKAAKEGAAEIVNIFGINKDNLNVGEIALKLVENSKYLDWLKEKDKDGSYEDRKENVDELINTIAAYCEENPRATIASYLQSIALYTTKDEEAEESQVTLMSLHASKGLEFDIVFMVGVEHNILPHKKAVEERPDEGLEEERRLCYVGFTRARKLLTASWCQMRQASFRESERAAKKSCLPSQFLKESGLMSKKDYDACFDTQTLTMAGEYDE